MSSAREIAIGIPLNLWQDPQGDVVLHYSREECLIYFGCWVEAGIPADYLGQLIFHHSWAVRGLCLEGPPYKTKEPLYRSSILVVQDSRWLHEVSEQRLQYYPEWKTWDTREYLHYVVSGHDNYYDIIATGFEEQSVPETEAGALQRLIHAA